MALYQTLKDLINSLLPDNNNNEITAANNRTALFDIIEVLGEFRTLMGVATPSTTPSTTEGLNFYLAGQQGTYVDFDGYIHNTEGLLLLTNDENGAWSGEVIDVGYALQSDLDSLQIVVDNILIALDSLQHTLVPFTDLINFQDNGVFKYYSYSAVIPYNAPMVILNVAGSPPAGCKYVCMLDLGSNLSIDTFDIRVNRDDYGASGRESGVYKFVYEYTANEELTLSIIDQEKGYENDVAHSHATVLLPSTEPINGVLADEWVSPSSYIFDVNQDHPGFDYVGGSLEKTASGTHILLVTANYSISCDTDTTDVLVALGINGQRVQPSFTKVTLNKTGGTQFTLSGCIVTKIIMSYEDTLDLFFKPSKNTNLSIEYSSVSIFAIERTN